MTRRFGTRWIRRLMQDGRGALHRHDLDGRDHDRYHHGWRAPCNEWYRTLQHISIQQQAMQFFAESVCQDNALLDLRLSTTKRLMGSACLRRGGKTRASQRKLGATSTSASHSSMEEPAARTASVHQCHALFFRHDAGPKVRLHRADDAMMRPGQASLQPPRSWRQQQIFKREH